MEYTSFVWTILLAGGVPSAVVGFCFWRLQQKLNKRERARAAREESQKKQELLLINCIGAAIALGEASAIAIRDGKCNGEMALAMKYAQDVKRSQRDFLTDQGVRHIY